MYFLGLAHLCSLQKLHFSTQALQGLCSLGLLARNKHMEPKSTAHPNLRPFRDTSNANQIELYALLCFLVLHLQEVTEKYDLPINPSLPTQGECMSEQLDGFLAYCDT